MKLEGEVENVDILDCLSVVRESDLYSRWAPFCSKSELLSYLGRIEIITYLYCALPLMHRDAVIHAFGIDASYEFGCVLILGDSVDSWVGVDFPPKPTTINSDRMLVRGFQAMIKPLSKTSGTVSIVANIDPKCPLPQSLINFGTKKLAGVLLYYLIKEAEKIKIQPEKNPYAIRMREDPTEFYGWMGPRMDAYFTKLQNGTLPVHLPMIVPTGSPRGSKTPPRLQTPRGNSTYTNPSTKNTIHKIHVYQDRVWDNILLWPYVFPILLYLTKGLLSTWLSSTIMIIGMILTWYYGILGFFSVEQRGVESTQKLQHNGSKVIITLGVVGDAILWGLLPTHSDCLHVQCLLTLSLTFASAMVTIKVLRKMK